MCQTRQEIEEALGRLVHELDPEALHGSDAKVLVGFFSRLEHLAAAGKALCARRVSQTGAFETDGHRHAGEWLAQQTGDSIGSALSVLEAASQVQALPEVEEAFRSGELSPAQVKEVAGAAVVDPGAAAELLEAARSENLEALKRRAARVKAARASEEDEAARARRLHATRRLRSFTGDDGAFHLEARLTPEAGAPPAVPAPGRGGRHLRLGAPGRGPRVLTGLSRRCPRGARHPHHGDRGRPTEVPGPSPRRPGGAAPWQHRPGRAVRGRRRRPGLGRDRTRAARRLARQAARHERHRRAHDLQPRPVSSRQGELGAHRARRALCGARLRGDLQPREGPPRHPLCRRRPDRARQPRQDLPPPPLLEDPRGLRPGRRARGLGVGAPRRET